VLCDLFFNQLAKERKELMGERKYYCECFCCSWSADWVE